MTKKPTKSASSEPASGFAQAIWRPDPIMVEGGAGWWTAIGIVDPDDGGKPFIRVARGKAVPGNDPVTNSPVKQQQKFNVKNADDALAIADALRDLAPELA